MRQSLTLLLCVVSLITLSAVAPPNALAKKPELLSWEELPSLPDKLGVAGPFAGVHNDALIVAGGANFPPPVWENEKVWCDRIHVLTKTGDGFVWKDGGTLARPGAYGAAGSTPGGGVCMGGNNSEETFDPVFLLRWDVSKGQVTATDYPSLPKPCAFGSVPFLAS